MDIVYAIIVFLLFVASITVLARMVASLFSEKSAQRIRQRRRLHALWLWSIPLFCFVWFVLPILIFHGPPDWWERRSQRREVQASIQAMGGWEVLKKDCLTFAQQPGIVSGSSWYSGDTNGLPASIISLQSKRVDFYQTNVSKNFNDSGLPVVRVTLFGSNSSGGRGVPWYGFDVICGNSSPNYLPKRKRSSERNWHYKKITEGVYEFH